MTRTKVALFSILGVAVSAVSVYTLTPPPVAPVEAMHIGLDVSVSGVQPLALAVEDERPAPPEQAPPEPVVAPADDSASAPPATPPMTKPTREQTPSSRPASTPAATATAPTAKTPEPIRIAITGPNGFTIQGSIPVLQLPPLPPIVPIILPPPAAPSPNAAPPR